MVTREMKHIVLFITMLAFIQRITMVTIVKYRTLQKHSEHDSLAISLPVQWTRLLRLRQADTVKMTFEDNRRIIVEKVTN